MQKVLKFICCSSYDFDRQNGQRLTGISCKCYDPETKLIVKVKTDTMLDYDFGDDVTVDIVFSGRFVHYKVAA